MPEDYCWSECQTSSRLCKCCFQLEPRYSLAIAVVRTRRFFAAFGFDGVSERAATAGRNYDFGNRPAGDDSLGTLLELPLDDR